MLIALFCKKRYEVMIRVHEKRTIYAKKGVVGIIVGNYLTRKFVNYTKGEM